MASFYDLDSILAEGDKVPIRFQYDVEGVGYVDPSIKDDKITAGSVLNLPLWLSRSLLELQYEGDFLVEMELPTHYREATMRKLGIDPCHIKLREKSTHYFEVGIQMGALLLRPLCVAFCERLLDLLNTAKSSYMKDTTDYAKELTTSEQQVFRDQVVALKSCQEWKTGGMKTIRKKELTGKKRSRKVRDANSF